jgi:hypothetical protein
MLVDSAAPRETNTGAGPAGSKHPDDAGGGWLQSARAGHWQAKTSSHKLSKKVLPQGLCKSDACSQGAGNAAPEHDRRAAPLIAVSRLESPSSDFPMENCVVLR